MSLINEALKKARAEAARQEAVRGGAPLPAPTAYLQGRERSRSPSLAVALALASALGLLAFWWGRRSAVPLAPAETARAADLAGVAPPPSVAAGTGPAAAAAPATRPGAPAAPTPTPQAPAAAPEREVSTPAAVPPGAATERTAPPGPGPPAAARVEGRRAAPAAAPRGPTVYVEIAELPDGRLELSGIAWSSTDPSALINGRIVGRGERIAGHTVVEIEPRQVELIGDGGPIVLRLP